MKIMSGALLAGLAVTAAAQQPAGHLDHSKNRNATVDYPALREHYFPFRMGDVRTYVYHAEEQVGPGIKKFESTYTESVISVRDITPGIRVVRMEIRGGLAGADHTRCGIGPMEGEPDSDHERTGPEGFWYIFAGRYVFTGCNQDALDKLVKAVKMYGPYKGGLKVPNCRSCNEYLLPLKAGRSWGGGDWKERPPHETRWEWFVEGQETVSVPGGTFKDCYRVIYDTNPDDLKIWICPGAGLVAYEATHHGSLMHYRIELCGMTIKPTEK